MFKKTNPLVIPCNSKTLSKLSYIKVIYTGLDGKLYEKITETKFMGASLFSLYFKSDEPVDIKCPNDITLKFVTPDEMFLANAVLKEMKQLEGIVYLSITPPNHMVKQQKRKYCRVNVDRSCVLVVTDQNGHSTAYLAKTVNLSACGILINNLEKMENEDPVNIEFSQYDCYHVVLFLETDKILKLFGRYVRSETVGGSLRYAFRFLSVKPEDTELLSDYVTREQVNQLRIMLNDKAT